MKAISRNFKLAMMIGAVLAQANVDTVTGGAAPTPETTATPEATPSAETTATVTDAAASEAAIKAEKEKQIAEIKANFNNEVDVKETNFFFRKVKNEVKGEDGKVSTVETKRPTVTLPIPVPSVEGIVAILTAGGKQLDLLLEAVAGVVIDQARDYVNDHEDVNASNFPYASMSWEVIANMPKAERRGGGISKELWDDFEKDYQEIMPGLTGKKQDAVNNAARIFKAKFQGAQTNKPVLKVLEAQLGIYAQNTTQGEALLPCIEFLQNKLEKLLNTDESNLLAAL